MCVYVFIGMFITLLWFYLFITSVSLPPFPHLIISMGFKSLNTKENLLAQVQLHSLLYINLSTIKTTTKKTIQYVILSPFTIPSTFLVILEENVQDSNSLSFSHDNSILIQKYHSTPGRELSLNSVSYHPSTSIANSCCHSCHYHIPGMLLSEIIPNSST